MAENAPEIVIVDQRISSTELARLVDLFFGDMVANYYPGKAPACIEYTALINIRPTQGNRSMEIADAVLRERVREITWARIGRGEALP